MSATLARDEVTGLEKVVLKGEQGEVLELYRHGGHIVSWRSADQRFGMLGPLGQHGFARNSTWDVVQLEGSTAVLEYLPSHDQLELFPHPFKLQMKVTVGSGTLTQDLICTNTGEESFEFTAALHTYYKVSHISHVSVAGLEGLTYQDNLEARAEKLDSSQSVTFAHEVDRIYLHAPDTITVTDSGTNTEFVIRKSGFPDAVVWNPWIDKAKSMADFGDEEYQVMVCIEPAVAGSGAKSLAPGQSWTGRQHITYQPAPASKPAVAEAHVAEEHPRSCLGC